MPLLGGNIRRTIAGFLGLALLAALWTTSLARISDKPTAVGLLTDAGTQLVNPLLVSNGTGITKSTYQQLEREAAAHPNQPVQILFIKPAVLGRDIAGKSYPQALQVIFGKVAEAYYAGGPGAAFALPPQLQSALGTYTPFIQMKNQLPGIPQSPLPQLPSFVAPLFTHLGFTPTTLTADGHNGAVSFSLWLWLASGVLAALLALLGTGWARLSTIAWSVFHSAWHITLLLMLAAYLVSRNPTQAAPYRDVLGLVGGSFFPVYAAATVAGVAGIIVCFVATRVLRQTTGARTPAMVAAGVADRPPHPYTPPVAGMEPSGYMPYTPPPTEPRYPPLGYPQPQPAYPPLQQPSYPAQQPSYPPQVSYPPQPPYQPQQPVYPPYPQSSSHLPQQVPAVPESAPQPARPPQQQPVFPEVSPLAPDEGTNLPS